jgi:hypothetical protein
MGQIWYDGVEAAGAGSQRMVPTVSTRRGIWQGLDIEGSVLQVQVLKCRGKRQLL